MSVSAYVSGDTQKLLDGPLRRVIFKGLAAKTSSGPQKKLLDSLTIQR